MKEVLHRLQQKQNRRKGNLSQLAYGCNFRVAELRFYLRVQQKTGLMKSTKDLRQKRQLLRRETA